MVHNYLRSFKGEGADYIYVTDIDNSPCIVDKKKKTCNLRNIDSDKIIVVIKEIESWYLGGLGDEESKKLKMHRTFSNTDDITKEQFNDSIPKKFNSRINFLLEILNFFSIEIAKQRNKSFRYFIEKYNC